MLGSLPHCFREQKADIHHEVRMFSDMKARRRRTIMNQVNLKFVGCLIVGIKQNASCQIINVHMVTFISVRFVPRQIVREYFI